MFLFIGKVHFDGTAIFKMAATEEPSGDEQSESLSSSQEFDYEKFLQTAAERKASLQQPGTSFGTGSTNEHKGFTKKGKVRQRATYDESPASRKMKKVEERIQLHQVKESCNCVKNCSGRISHERRQCLNDEYWSLTKNEQEIFVSSNIEIGIVKRRRGEDSSKRQRSVKYFLLDEKQEKQEVCKPFFLSTLGYKKTNDNIIVRVMNNIQTSGVPSSSDQRGKAPKSKIDRDLLNAHVESFKPNVSHYRREHAPNRKYLPSDLTITAMHKDFQKSHPDVKCSYELYRKNLADLNISFVTLGHEECETCEVFKLHNPDHQENTGLQLECEECKQWEKHRNKAKEAREKYQSDANNPSPDTVYFSGDLEKVIMLPRIDMFKKVIFCQRIIVFNESFAPLGSQQNLKPLAVLWHECVSGRKKEDLVSTFHAFFLQNRDAKFIVLWLDNCAAQNKNWTLFSYLVNVINSDDIAAQSITLRYFEPGHTFMSADSFHHQVEMSLQRKKKVYDFSDFVDCVRASNSGKVDVKEMTREDFYAWPDNSSKYKISRSKPRPYLKDMVEVTAERGNYELKYRSAFTEEQKTLNFLMEKAKQAKRPQNIPSMRGIQSNRKKMILENILSLIPANRQEFWKSLPVNESAVDLREHIED